MYMYITALPRSAIVCCSTDSGSCKNMILLSTAHHNLSQERQSTDDWCRLLVWLGKRWPTLGASFAGPSLRQQWVVTVVGPIGCPPRLYLCCAFFTCAPRCLPPINARCASLPFCISITQYTNTNTGIFFSISSGVHFWIFFALLCHCDNLPGRQWIYFAMWKFKSK